MTRSRARQRACTAKEAQARLVDGRSFLDAAELFARENADVATSNAVHAGIAAADVLTCLLLGRRSSSGDHSDAVTLLQETDQHAANRLRRLLRIKTKAQYSDLDVSGTEATAALRQATALLDAAEELLGN